MILKVLKFNYKETNNTGSQKKFNRSLTIKQINFSFFSHNPLKGRKITYLKNKKMVCTPTFFNRLTFLMIIEKKFTTQSIHLPLRPHCTHVWGKKSFHHYQNQIYIYTWYFSPLDLIKIKNNSCSHPETKP